MKKRRAKKTRKIRKYSVEFKSPQSSKFSWIGQFPTKKEAEGYKEYVATETRRSGQIRIRKVLT